MTREIVADYISHEYGQREVVDWDRESPSGGVETFRNVPLVYLRECTREEYLAQKPRMAPSTAQGQWFFYEVSVD